MSENEKGSRITKPATSNQQLHSGLFHLLPPCEITDAELPSPVTHHSSLQQGPAIRLCGLCVSVANPLNLKSSKVSERINKSPEVFGGPRRQGADAWISQFPMSRKNWFPMGGETVMQLFVPSSVML